jgi:hypothetical protein
MSEPTKPSVPGWRFAVNEVSTGVYKATGVHDDGRSVERTNSDLNALYRDIADDARRLPERRRAAPRALALKITAHPGECRNPVLS